MLKIKNFQMALDTWEMWSNGIKIAFCKPLRKIAQRRQWYVWKIPSVIHLNYSTLFTQHRSPNLDIFDFNYWFKPSPLNEFLVKRQHWATDSDSDNVIACVCDLDPPPPNQKSWLRLWCSLNKFSNWECLGPLSYKYSYNWLFSWQNNNLEEKFSTGLLFIAKILLEAMYFTSPYLGQITSKI